MIDHQIVGAIAAGDLSGYQLTADDARFIVQQKVATPVHYLLKSQPQAADEQSRRILYRATRQATIHSLMQVGTSNSLTSMLSEAGIPALIYKGVALAAVQGGAWSGRESLDVDVLIDGADVERAHAVLASHGLVRWDGKTEPPNALFRYHDIEMAYRGMPAYVDLHWRLDSPGYLDIPFASLWSNRRRVTTNGLDAWTLGAEETALVSAVHGTREGLQTLSQMLDASLLLTGMPQERWHAVTRLAQNCGASRSLAVALAVAESCGVQNLPASPGPWARSLADQFIRDWTKRPSAVKLGGARSPSDALRRRVDRWRLAPRPSAALDGLARASVRQLLHKRTWTITSR